VVRATLITVVRLSSGASISIRLSNDLDIRPLAFIRRQVNLFAQKAFEFQYAVVEFQRPELDLFPRVQFHHVIVI